jgi:hypothetical protein
MLGRMSLTSRRLLFWTPRILCILFAVFLSLFALDVFDEHLGFWKTLLALAIHLIPTWIVLGAMMLASRWQWVGASCSPSSPFCMWSWLGDDSIGQPRP